MDRKTITVYGELILVFVLWGSLYVVCKYTLDKVSAFVLIFLRSLVAAVCLLLFLKVRRIAKPIDRTDWPLLLVSGFGGYFLAVGFQTLGTKYAGASVASLINSTNPVFISVAAAALLKERLTPRRIVGTLIAIVGVYIILNGASGTGQLWGIAASLASVCVWSVITTVNRRLMRKYDSLQLTAYGVAIAAAVALPFALWEGSVTPVKLDLSVLLAVLYMGAFCTGVAHLLWNRCISRMDAGRCSAFYPIQTIASSVFGFLFLHEQITWNFIIGTAVTILGILLSLWQRRPSSPHVPGEPENNPQKQGTYV